MIKNLAIPAILLSAVTLTACKEADIASQNISRAADEFEINRRIVFYNGITADYILVIEGLCSLGNHDGPKDLSVTCKTGPSQYKKHFLGLSDNVTFMAEQIEPADVSGKHYKVIFKPASIIPDIEIK